MIISNKNTEFPLKKHDFKNILLFCFLSSIVYVLPLLLANQFYSDDIKRQTTGEGWLNDGRPLASYIMQFLSGSEQVKDLFPYTLIIGAFLTAISGYIIVWATGIEKNRKYKISAFLLLCSPLMIENLAYRYDVLTISISIFLTVIPFLFKGNSRKYISLTSIALLLSLFIYQASLVIYVLVSLLLLIKFCFEQNSPKKITEKIFYYALPVLISFGLMKAINLIVDLPYHGRDKTVFSSQNPFKLLKLNSEKIFYLLRTVFESPLYSLFFLILAGLFLFSLGKFLLEKNQKAIHKILALGFFLCIPIVIIAIPLLLENTFIVPRVFVGFSFLIYGTLLFIDKSLPKITPYLAGFFILCALPVMASLGKFLKEQNEMQTYVISDIISHVDLNNKTLVFDGQIPISKDSERTLENYFFLRYFYISFLGNENYLFDSYFQSKSQYLYSPTFLKENDRIEMLKTKYSIPIIHTTNHYYIRGNENSVIVDFNKTNMVSPMLYDHELPKSIDLKFNLEEVKLEDKQLYVRGWAFRNETNSFSNKKTLFLIHTNSNSIYSCELTLEIRKDVSKYFNGNHDNSGFNSTIQIDDLPEGEYQIGIGLGNSTNQGFILTDKIITINK